MKIQTREATVPKQGVSIAQNLQKESIRIDKDGNQIDPRTKQIIKRNRDEEDDK